MADTLNIGHHTADSSYIIGSVDSTTTMAAEAEHLIFGSNSHFSTAVQNTPIAITEELGWNQMWEASALIFLLLVIYLLGLYRYGDMMRWGVRNFLSLRTTVAMTEGASLEFSQFVRYGRVLSILTFSLLVTGYIYLDYSPRVNLLLLYLITVASITLCALLSRGLHLLLSIFDYSPIRWRVISSVSTFDSAIGVTLMTIPLSTLFLTPSLQTVVWGTLFAYYVLHIFRIIYLNISLKFSFLQSILYICAVEIVPFTLVWGIVKHFKVL